MLSYIRIFTATLGGKNSLTKEKVFSNVAENEGQLRSTKKYLHVQSIAKGHLHFCKSPLCCFMQCKRDLFQTGKGFLDTLHSFYDVLVAGSIAHTETFGTSKASPPTVATWPTSKRYIARSVLVLITRSPSFLPKKLLHLGNR